MSAKQALMTATDQLEQVLATANDRRGPGWGKQVEEALAGVEAAVRRHAEAMRSEGGRMVNVDRPMVQSPGFLHRMEQLREQMDGVLQEIEALRARMPMLTPPRGAGSADNLAGALSVAPELGAVTDFAVFCKRARQLVEELQQFEQEEADLILRSVNTDIGAGD